MNWKQKATWLVLVYIVGISSAHADVSFHGYGQTVVGTTLSNTRTLPFQPYYSADPSFQPESNFALQASASLNDSISAVAQVLALGQDDFKPKFHWAYLKYQLNDTFALKAGRMQLPYYQFSDFFYVGEAYPWIIPPEAVYLSQSTGFDGLDLSAEQSIGDWYLFWQGIFGRVDESVTVPQTSNNPVYNLSISERNIFGSSLDATYNDWLSLRAGLFVGKLSTLGVPPIDQVVSDMRSEGYYEAAKGLDYRDDPTAYYTVGAQITRNKWVVLAEYSGLQNINSSSWLTSYESEYISVGRHFGRWLPLITVGHRNQWMSTEALKSLPPNTTDNAAGSPYKGLFTYNNFIINQSESPQERAKEYYYEMTLRYDLTGNVALKLDWTYYQSKYKTSDYTQPFPFSFVPYSNPSDANRFSAAVTFSF